MVCVDDLLDVEGLVVDHEGVRRVVHHHVLRQIEELTARLAVFRVVLSGQE